MTVLTFLTGASLFALGIHTKLHWFLTDWSAYLPVFFGLMYATCGEGMRSMPARQRVFLAGAILLSIIVLATAYPLVIHILEAAAGMRPGGGAPPPRPPARRRRRPSRPGGKFSSVGPPSRPGERRQLALHRHLQPPRPISLRPHCRLVRGRAVGRDRRSRDAAHRGALDALVSRPGA